MLDTALKALLNGWSIVPTGLNKKPLLDTWAELQKRHTTPDEAREWTRNAGPLLEGWAVVTGNISKLLVIDFDGQAGCELANRIGARAHVRTGSGGLHWYVRAPDHIVKTINGKSKKLLGETYPGLDIRAEGGYAVFVGQNETGPYTQLRDPTDLDTLDAVPEDIQRALGIIEPVATPAPTPARATKPVERAKRTDRRVPTETLLTHALDQLSAMGRNDAGFWLACQLRDNNYTQNEARDTMNRFADHTGITNTKGQAEPYTHNDANTSLRSAYTQPARAAWEDKPLPDTSVTRGGTTTPSTPKPKKQKDPSLSEYATLFLNHLTEHTRFIAYYELNETWWEYAHGVYVEKTERAMLRELDLLLQSHGFDDLSKTKLRDILLKIAHTPGIARMQQDLRPRELNVTNGILNLETLELRDHTPEFFSIIQSAAAWNPNAECEAFNTYLEQIIPSEAERSVLWQFLGYALTADTNHQKALALIGEGGTGKGTVTRALTALLGGIGPTGLVAAMGLNDLQDGSPKLEPLVGRRVLLASETEKRVDWMAFKRVTGEDPVTVDPKYRTPYSVRLQCKIIISSNVLPHLGEDATNSSLTRRLLPVSFNVKLDEVETNLDQVFSNPAEMSGILLLAVMALHRLWTHGDFDEGENTLLRQMIENSNRVITFLDECCQPDPTASVGANELFKTYTEWADANRMGALASNRFRESAEAAFKYLKWDAAWKRTKITRVYEGIAFRRIV